MLFKRVGRWGLILLGGMLMLAGGLNLWVVASTRSHMFRSVAEIPVHSVGLVLGTSNKTSSGKPNLFFENRIQAAADLFHQKKIERILVSGDNQSSPYYNEPYQMKKSLVARGVPAKANIIDDAGVRTLDSIIRCYSVFGESNITIITQGFHGYRALFISNYYDLDAQVLVAPGIPLSQTSVRVYIREFFARPQAVFDLFVFKTHPVIQPSDPA
jgi:SanA protein